MKYVHTVSRRDNANVLLSITVPKDIVSETYKTILHDVTKKANIKGFRKGKAPPTIIESKYAQTVKIEATEKIIKDAFAQVVENAEHKPLPYATPTLEHKEGAPLQGMLITPNEEFSFSISYDTTPHVTPADISTLHLTHYKVSISDSDIEQELKKIQERNSLRIEKEDNIALGDTVAIACVTLDNEGKEINTTEQKEFSIVVGEDTDLYNIGEDLIGLKKGDEKTLEKSYPPEYKVAKLAGASLTLKVTIIRVSRIELPEIDDELAQDVGEEFKTLQDLRTHISTQLTKDAENVQKTIDRAQIVDYLVTHSSIEIPHANIVLQQEHMWRNMLHQYQTDEQKIMKDLKASNTTKEAILENWKEDATKSVAEQLVIQKLIELEKIEISDEELEKIVKEDCARANQPYDKTMEYLKANNLLFQIKHEKQQEILFENLANRTIIKDGKDIILKELYDIRNEQQRRQAPAKQ